MSRPNPLRDPQDRRLPRIAGPCGMVLFGVTGDLSRKKVMPAIYDLANRGLLPPGFSLVGFARRDWADQDFAQIVHDAVKEHARTEFREEVWKQLAEGFRFVPGNFDDDVAFDQLRRTLEELDQLRGTAGNYAFYLAIPPGFFGDVVGQLKEHGLARAPEDSWRRVVVEKPFGHDLKSARELNHILNDVFPPGSVFRIDHYLGKETVQNILAMRFANEMFEPLWNSNYVDHVQITMAEDVGIGGRAGYYDGIGAARDVIQNHLLQLMSLVAMEEPTSFDAESLRIEKQKVLSSVVLPRRLDLTTARGQYDAGWAGGRKAIGYLEEEGIKKTSTTETHRQAPGPAGHRGGRGVQASAAPAVHRDGDRGADPERAGGPDPTRRGDDDPVRLQGAGHGHGDPRREHGLHVRRVVHRGEPGGLRAADPRRAARRPAAVPAARGGRAVLEDPGPDPRALGEQG
jgi:glucose-6-phosphate 1-dehydrogenase